MKNFFGSIFINRDKLLEAGINYPIKVEYYKITDEERTKQKNHLVYGVQIIKTEYRNEQICVENKTLYDVANDEEKVDDFLNLLKENEVTPITVDYILEDWINVNKTLEKKWNIV